MNLRRATPDDQGALMALFDEAVAWMVARGQPGQWGSEPWSARPSAVERARGMISSDGAWAIEHDGEVVAALVVGEHPPHVDPVNVPELYVELLITSRRLAGRDLGGELVRHARTLAVERGAELLRVDCWAGQVFEMPLR